MHQNPNHDDKIGCSGTGHGDKEPKPAKPIAPKFPTALSIANEIENAMALSDQKKSSILDSDMGVKLQIDNMGIVSESSIREAKLGDTGYLCITQSSEPCAENVRPEIKYEAVGYRSYEAATLRFAQQIRSDVVHGQEITIAVRGTSPLNIAESKHKESPFALNRFDGTLFSVIVKASISTQILMEILNEGRPASRQRIFDRKIPKVLDSMQIEELALPAVPKKTNIAPARVAIKPSDTDFQV